MIDQLRNVLLNHCRVVDVHYAVTVRVGCNELIGRKLNQLRNKLLDLRHVINSDPAVSVRVADEELARNAPICRLVGRFACYLCDFRRPAGEFIGIMALNRGNAPGSVSIAKLVIDDSADPTL